MAYAHLHVHTEYSLLDGSNKIKEYVARVKELGMDSAAITDHGVMYGAVEFYQAAKAAGIKPILGCEVYVAPGSRLDREAVSGEERYHHLVLLAESQEGYANLMRLVSRGFTEGFYYRPRVDMELLRRFHRGLIALSACLAGEVQKYLLRGEYAQAKEAALRLEDCFGKGNFFLELQDHGLREQQEVNLSLLELSKECQIPLVATNDVHYTLEEDGDAHDILLCLQTQRKQKDADRLRYPGGQFFVKSEEQMRQLFPYAPEALDNTQKIADRCQVELDFDQIHLPIFPVPAPYSGEAYLEKLCREGLERRYGRVGPELEERLAYELGVIGQMGYVDYFLIVWDFIHYAKTQGIPVGPGRGSAAGSLVSYCLGITDIDPIRYQLLFERFLNPERVSMPDIDIDFCFVRRQEVIDYVSAKYGADRVVQIITFGTLAARGVLRDVGRVMDLPYAFCDTIAKMIPMELGITLDRALQINGQLAQRYAQEEQVRLLIDMGRRLEGLPRHSSIHAAGVLICPRAAEEFVPLSKGADGAITTQFTMGTLEQLGLLKMDFLGLRTLTVLQDALDMANKHRPSPLRLEDMDMEDAAVFQYIGQGRTEGMFQLESAGMTAFMRDLQPRNLEDIIAGISLYRPGPMDFIPKYLAGKRSQTPIRYSAPQLEPILSTTYGCMVYQEQVMQIVRDLGGYTLGRSDLVRRAMSKKKAEVMERERANFVYGNAEEGVPGCISRGISEAVALEIFEEMTDFAKYAFNKSHAAAYAVVAYQTAYLKYYHPVEFMAALLSSVMDHTEKVSSYILACKSMGMRILPPDINLGEAGFTPFPQEGSIRYALTAIKGVGRNIILAILEERRQRGPFADLEDFASRVQDLGVNKRAVESFILAGAMDGLGMSRKGALEAYAGIADRLAKEKRTGVSGQMSLFSLGDMGGGHIRQTFREVPEFDEDRKLALEKEVLGLYISGHPLEGDRELWQRVVSCQCGEFAAAKEAEEGAPRLRDGQKALIGGLVVDKKIHYTRQNQPMAFITLEDFTGTMELIVFARDYERYMEFLVPDAKIFVLGRVSAEEDKAAKLLCEQLMPFDRWTPGWGTGTGSWRQGAASIGPVAPAGEKLWMQFPSKREYMEEKPRLEAELGLWEAHGGEAGKGLLMIYIKEERQYASISLGHIPDMALQQALEAAFGAGRAAFGRMGGKGQKP